MHQHTQTLERLKMTTKNKLLIRMSAKIPEDMVDTIKNLEGEASRCLSKGNYLLATRLYHVIFLSLFDRQFLEKRRIHLGAPLHMEGLSLLLQDRFNDGLKSIFLAYITDLVNAPLGEEDEADQAPAHKVLLDFFGVSESTFQGLKILSREVKDRNQPFDPQILLNKFLRDNSLSPENILNLASHEPTPQQIRAIRPRYFEVMTIEAATKRGETNRDKLNVILNNLFVNPDLAKYLPRVLTESEVHILTILSDTYFVLAFFNKTEWAKIVEFREKGVQQPLPGLIRPEANSGSSAYSIEKTKNFLFKNNQVSNQYSFSRGKDTTILLIEHRQTMKSDELTADYTIGLAYLIFFGEEITSNNFYGYLEDLAAYSFKVWRSEFGDARERASKTN